MEVTMPKPGEHKTVQARILAYAQEEAEKRRAGFPTRREAEDADKNVRPRVLGMT